MGNRNRLAARTLGMSLLLAAAGCVTITAPLPEDTSGGGIGNVNGTTSKSKATPTPTPAASGSGTTASASPSASPSVAPAFGSVAWSLSARSLPVAVSNTSGTVVNNSFVVVGGISATGLVSTVTSFPIDATGNLGAPVASTVGFRTPGATADLGVCSEGLITAGTGLVAMGGQTDNGSFATGVAFGQFSGSSIANWTGGTSLPIGRQDFGTARDSARCYIVGGRTAGGTSGTPTATILSATVDSLGNIPSWVPAATMSQPRLNAATAVLNGRLYVFGGTSDPTNTTVYNDVVSYPINADGTLGAATTELNTVDAGGNLPNAFGAAMFAYNNRLYLVGGMNTGGQLSGTYIAVLGANGLSTWHTAATINLPDRVGIGAYGTDGQGHFYLAGGAWEAGQTGGQTSLTNNVYVGTVGN